MEIAKSKRQYESGQSTGGHHPCMAGVAKDVLNYALSVVMLNEAIDNQKLCEVQDEDSGIVLLSD